MRTGAAPALAALAGQNAMIIWLIRMDLSDSVYLCTATHDVTWAGQTWMGAGVIGSVDEVQDSAGERRGLKFSMSSVPPEYLSLAMTAGYRGKKVRIYEAIVGDAGILDAPLVWSGSLNQPLIEEGASAGQITISAEHRGATFARAKPLRYTDGDQQRLYPGDKSMQFVVSQANHVDIWPSAAFFRK